MNGITTASSRSQSNGGLQPAPRVVPQPESHINHQMPFLLSIIFTPFNLVYRLLTGWFRFVGRIFPFLPRLWGPIVSRTTASSALGRNTSGRRGLSPRDTAARFIREFEEEYGSHTLPFMETGYATAFDTAKRDLKYLLVILVSPEHDDTSSYVRETLLSPAFTTFLSEHKDQLLLWAGNVLDAEAYQVSTAISCTKFPFAGLIVHTPSVSSTSMSVVARITGPVPPDSFVSTLRTAISQNDDTLARVRATRAEQQATRSLREEQNSAYERSLATDRERARQKKEAEERKKNEEKEAARKVEEEERNKRNLEQWRLWRAQRIKPEPSADVKDAVRISLRMPSGVRVVRKFESTLPMEELYAFVECHDLMAEEENLSEKIEKPEGWEMQYKFVLVSPMPRQEYGLDKDGSIKERVGRSANLLVERLDPEEDSDVEDLDD